MKKIIPYGNQTITKSDIKIVTKSLTQDFLTTGPGVNFFEKKFSQKIKCKYCVSSNSGTSAIFLALKAINIKKDDNVIIPANNFIAAANICRDLGAKIFFSDVDKNTGQATPSNILNCIKKNKIKNIKVFFSMHNGGFSNYAKEFYQIKKKFKCYFIEDACHSLGGKNSLLKNDFIGNCRYSDFSTFSFHPLKTITTGEGGMTTTNNKTFYTKMLKYRNHGFAIKKKILKYYNWKHKLEFNGYNLRLTDIQCYLGVSQLEKMNYFVKKRNEIAKKYLNYLTNQSEYIFLPKFNKFLSAWHLFIIRFNLKKLTISRDKIIQELFKKKILTQVHYVPNYRQKPFLIKNISDFKGCEEYYKSCLSLPIFPNITTNQIVYIVKNLKSLIKKYKK